MMYHKKYFLIVLLLLFYLFTCKEDPTSSDNRKPVVSIVSPADYSEFVEGTIITISAYAQDNESVKEVKFYIDSELEFTDNSEPYEYEWDTSGKIGSHSISAKVYDASNNMGESIVVSIIINANTAPTASFTISPFNGDISTIFQFDASGSSDKEDFFSQLRFNWDWENDGTWDVTNSTTYNPTHQFSLPGLYTVKLKVTDSRNLFDESTKSVSTFETGTVTDIDGNVYLTVKVGNQWWMAENLKVTRYRNGDAIPNVRDNPDWLDLTTAAYCVYNNDDGLWEIYGLLYNWYAVDDSRNLAPSGWHVPVEEEWKELEMYLGMSQLAVIGTGWRGTDEGSKMKDANYWYGSPLSTTNESGLSVLPGGYRYGTTGTYNEVRRAGFLWSATDYSTNYAWGRYLFFDNLNVNREYHYKRYGFSVRCVKD